jgi:hypothetical protein
MRTLAEGSSSGIHLLFGLRTADFDNDFRAVVGLKNIERESGFESNVYYVSIFWRGEAVRRKEGEHE